MIRLAVAASIIGLWVLVSEAGWVRPLFLPSPLSIVQTANSELAKGAGVTMLRALSGWLVGVLVAYVVHMLGYLSRYYSDLDTQFAAARAVPTIAILPLFLLWFGFGETGRIILVSLTAAIYFIAPLDAAVRNVPQEWHALARNLRLSRWRTYVSIMAPAALSNLLGAFRLTFAVSLTISVASDYIGAQYGLGKFIESARITYNVPAIFMAIIVAAASGILIDWIIRRTFGYFIHWSGKTFKA